MGIARSFFVHLCISVTRYSEFHV